MYGYTLAPLGRNLLAQIPSAPAAAPQAPPTVPSGPSVGARIAETLLTVGFAGAMTYTGIRTGLKGNGLNSAVAWAAGIGGGLLGLAGLATIFSPPLAARINPFKFD